MYNLVDVAEVVALDVPPPMPPLIVLLIPVKGSLTETQMVLYNTWQIILG